jgi:hypothetical protein
LERDREHAAPLPEVLVEVALLAHPPPVLGSNLTPFNAYPGISTAVTTLNVGAIGAEKLTV